MSRIMTFPSMVILFAVVLATRYSLAVSHTTGPEPCPTWFYVTIMDTANVEAH